ncbi:hypothetical protein [Bradyrhizobium sp. CCGE-LA001]
MLDGVLDAGGELIAAPLQGGEKRRVDLPNVDAAVLGRLDAGVELD